MEMEVEVNVRGLNDPGKVGEVRKFMSNNNICVMEVLETRVKQHIVVD